MQETYRLQGRAYRGSYHTLGNDDHVKLFTNSSSCFSPVSPKTPPCQYLGLVDSCAILPLQYARPLQSTPPTFATALQLNLELSTNRSSVGSSSSLRHARTQCYHHERAGMKATGKTCSRKRQANRVQILLTLANPFQGERFRVVLSINNKRFRG